MDNEEAADPTRDRPFARGGVIRGGQTVPVHLHPEECVHRPLEVLGGWLVCRRQSHAGRRCQDGQPVTRRSGTS